MLKMLNKRIRKDQKGFTLVEVLIVAAILVLLASIAVPQLFKAYEDARLQKLEIDARQILSAMERNVLQDKLNGAVFSAIPKTSLTQSVLSAAYGVNINIPDNATFSFQYVAEGVSSTAYGVVEVELTGGLSYSTASGKWE